MGCYPWSQYALLGCSSAPLSNIEKTLRLKDLPAFHHCLVSLTQCTGYLQGEHKSLRWLNHLYFVTYSQTTPGTTSPACTLSSPDSDTTQLKNQEQNDWLDENSATEKQFHPKPAYFKSIFAAIYARTWEYRDDWCQWVHVLHKRKKKGRKERKSPCNSVSQTPQQNKQQRSWKTSQVFGKKPKEDREDRICRRAWRRTGNRNHVGKDLVIPLKDELSWHRERRQDRHM